MSSSVWTDDQKLAGQVSSTYDDPTITYDQATKNYNGQTTTVWSNDPKN